MAGDDFELDINSGYKVIDGNKTLVNKGYNDLFRDYLESLGLDPHAPRYFLKKISNPEKCTISLHNIIHDILED